MLQPPEVLQLRDGAVEGSLEGCNDLKKKNVIGRYRHRPLPYLKNRKIPWEMVNYIHPMVWEEPKLYERFLQPLVRNPIVRAKISANQCYTAASMLLAANNKLLVPALFSISHSL